MGKRPPPLDRCDACGYSAEGLELDDICPECGKEFRRTQPGGPEAVASWLAIISALISTIAFPLACVVAVFPLSIGVSILGICSGVLTLRRVQLGLDQRASVPVARYAILAGILGITTGWIPTAYAYIASV